MLLFPRFFRRRRYDDLSVSIQEHIGERVDELVAEGMARTQAEQTARREFGNVGSIEQKSREAWQWPPLESIVADLKFVLRRLRKSPGAAAKVGEAGRRRVLADHTYARRLATLAAGA